MALLIKTKKTKEINKSFISQVIHASIIDIIRHEIWDSRVKKKEKIKYKTLKKEHLVYYKYLPFMDIEKKITLNKASEIIKHSNFDKEKKNVFFLRYIQNMGQHKIASFLNRAQSTIYHWLNEIDKYILEQFKTAHN